MRRRNPHPALSFCLGSFPPALLAMSRCEIIAVDTAPSKLTTEQMSDLSSQLVLPMLQSSSS
jgi:hypothetical protein